MNFFEHLLTFMNREEAERLIESMNSKPFYAFRLNTLKVKELSQIFDNVDFKKHPYVPNAYLYEKEKYELGKDILFDCGAYYIQEPAAMMAEYILDVKEEDIVLDMCAAPGGKTFGAVIDGNDKGLVVCNDIHEIRSRVLSSNNEKYGFSNTIVLNDDSTRYKKNFKNTFDKIILDAPCSGSAMFRKNDEAYNQWSIEKVMQCANIQKSLLEDAYEMLKGKGTLLYSTCSFSIQENEEVIQQFLEKHPDISIKNIDLNDKYDNTIGLKGGLRLYPHKFDGEGQVIFLLQKNASDELKSGKEMISCRLPAPAISFLKDIGFNYDKFNIVFLKNKYYLANFYKFNLDRIKINRYGLEIGEMFNDRFIPSHALAMIYHHPKNLYIELSRKQAEDYLQGLTITLEGNSGFKIVTYKNLPLGWVKHVNNTLKNHYPKGLRHNFR